MSFSTRHPAAKWCPPTSATVCGFSPLNVVTVFSKTSFKFRPSCPTILAETLILSSLYAIPIRIVPCLYVGEDESIEQIVPTIASFIWSLAFRITKPFPFILSIFSATRKPETSSCLYFV